MFDPDAWEQAWRRYAEGRVGTPTARRSGSRSSAARASLARVGRSALLPTLVLLVALPVAVAQSGDGAAGAPKAESVATGDALREGRRNPSSGSATRETELIGDIAAAAGGSGAGKGGYVLRESNVSDSGGGVIHGCRTQAPPPNVVTRGDKPCLRANNLSSGQAFQFQTTRGNVGGRIQVGGTDIRQVNPDGVPFETNARGLVRNLNAEMVGGLTAAQLRGQQGPPGPPGPQGPAGPQGEPALTSFAIRHASDFTAPAGFSVTTAAFCEPGEIATGGGADFVTGSPSSMFIQDSQPTPLTPGETPTGWFVRVMNDSPTVDLTFRATVVCASP